MTDNGRTRSDCLVFPSGSLQKQKNAWPQEIKMGMAYYYYLFILFIIYYYYFGGWGHYRGIVYRFTFCIQRLTGLYYAHHNMIMFIINYWCLIFNPRVASGLTSTTRCGRINCLKLSGISSSSRSAFLEHCSFQKYFPSKTSGWHNRR